MGIAGHSVGAGILSIVAVAGLLSSARADDVRWPAGACKPWSFSKAGGFHENEPEAWVACKQGKDEVRIALICHKTSISIRYTRIEKGKAPPPTNVRRRIVYKFPKREHADYVRYEGALTDWVVYRAATDPDHPIFVDFRSAPSVIVRLEGQKVVDQVPLNNAAKAVEKLLAACRRR